MEPGLFDASEEAHFEHPHARLEETPPPTNDFMDNTSPHSDSAAADQIFDDFISHPEDDVPHRSEVAEALEDRENEAGDVEAEKVEA